MKEKSLRTWLIQGFYRVLSNMSQQPTVESLQRPAIVFSPHQDDETLGCGGTIIKKVEAGAVVQIVFMTDGQQSHSHLLDPKELARLRKLEALAACEVLGVPASKVSFLDFQDGRLGEVIGFAVNEVRELLNQSNASELYLPYGGEPTDDHQATHAIVKMALAGQNKSYTIYEYPVWFWHHWPWVALPQETRQASRYVLKNTLLAILGLRLFLRFRWGLPVADVQERKLAALNQHKSQMTQLVDDPAWLTLHDVSKGEFLRNSLRNYELFYRYHYQPALGGH